MKPKSHIIVFLGISLLIISIATTFAVYLKNSVPSSPIQQTQDLPQPNETVLDTPTPTKPDIIPLVAVLPHHDVVKTQRDAMLAQLSAQSQPETTILLSPNHFNSGNSTIITSQQDWVVDNGRAIIHPNTSLIDYLVEEKIATDELSVFDYEHGIKNLLGEVNQYFPNTQLVPLIFKDTTTAAEIETLVTALLTQCPDCGVMASVDMSHYQPAAIADIHDIKTLRALQNLDDQEIWQTEVDSPASLAFLISWAEQKKLRQFNLSAHTNSGTLSHDPEAESTSHIIGYYSAGTTAPAANSITFTFAGDGMFGREIGYQFQNNNFVDLFSALGNRTFWGTDIAWINLEGPVSDQNLIQDRQPDDLVFNFSNQAIAALEYLKLTVVSLGNNHTHNQGQAGLETTRQLLDEAGIAYHGHPNQVLSDESVYHYKQGDLSVAMIALNALEDTTGIEALIQQEKDAGHYVIVTPHWGNEYQLVHSPSQEKLARAWFTAGADLIIGAHPHVIQDAQVISPEGGSASGGDGKLVLYSLGNFVFDQTFSKETQEGLLVTGSLTAEELNIVLVPLASTKLKPAIARGDQKQQIIDRVCANIQEYCKNGLIQVSINHPAD